jgi:acyl dehydratase
MSASVDVKVGDTLPEFIRKTSFDNWNRYAAVNEEFVPIHMDSEAARANGLPGAIGMGNLQWAYLHNVVREWLGERGRILKMSCQFRSPNLQDQVVTATGQVTEVRPTDAGTEVTLDVWTADQDGNKLAPGVCTVLLDA